MSSVGSGVLLPDPMLSRPGPLPSGSGGPSRSSGTGSALVSTEVGLRVRSRRGWDMTAVLPELRALPAGLVLDGELVAWKGSDPYFPLVCRRMLNREMSVPLTFVIFDVLRRDGVDLTTCPYIERRQELESLKLDAQTWTTCDRFDDGRALFTAGLRTRLRGCCREEALEPASAERSRLAEGQEPELLATRR
jgi:bifunctional non-homologous end joining protein LigD